MLFGIYNNLKLNKENIMPLLLQILLPFAVDLIKKYVSSSETKHDDKILNIIKVGANYLADKDNNTLSQDLVTPLIESSMKKGL